MPTCTRCLCQIMPGEGKTINRLLFCKACHKKLLHEARTAKALDDKDQQRLVSVLVPYKDGYVWSADRVSEAPPFGSD